MTTFPKYKRYKDSRVEWLGEVPEHWEVLPGRVTLSLNKDKNTGNIEETVLSLSYGRLVIKPPEKMTGLVPESLEGYQIINPGDIIIRPTDLQNDWTSLRVGLAKDRGIITSAYLGLKHDEKVSSEYLYYLLHSYDLLKIYYGMGTGLRQNLAWDDFKYLPLAIPPKSEQDRIVTFLDQKTAEIDALIAKKQRQIELLDEQKAILINRAVTRGLSGIASATTGLNPKTKLKPSGIEWLPAIPEKWNSIKLRHLAALIQTGPFGSQLHSEEYVENGTPVINPSHLKGARIVPDIRCAITDKKVTALSRHKLVPGDIVFARRGELGRCGLVTENEEGWICGTGSLLMRPKPGQIDPEYLALALSDRHVGEVLTLQSVGSTMDNLNTAMISSLAVPVPPPAVQAAIVESVHRTESAFRKLQTMVESQIQSLKTLRRTLIAHAVTGRFKV